jgi:hypothetical protein
LSIDASAEQTPLAVAGTSWQAATGGRLHVKLPPLMNTFESRMESPASAIARRMWLVPEWMVAVAASVNVSPSISVQIDPPPSLKSLFWKNTQLLPAEPNGLPQFTLLIDTGVELSGMSATLVPLTKNPKTSLKDECTYSLYSSDANTY